MPILNKPNEIRHVMKTYADKDVSIPCFCAENTYTMEGILIASSDFAKSKGFDTVTVYIAATGNYYGRQQLKNYTSMNSTEEGFFAFRSDIERLCRKTGPFENVLVIPSLDHGQPGLDETLFREGIGFWGCVMYDCSAKSLDVNRAMTAEFVKKYKNDYVIEGCVDEITESGEGDMKLTEAGDAFKFLSDTGVDLIVVNLGTEHRATAARLKYRSDIAKKIFRVTGRKLVLHGTSSLSREDLKMLRYDGIAKVNIWTVLETQVAEELLTEMQKNAGFILSDKRAEELTAKGFLGCHALEHARENNQLLSYMTELYRRNNIKVPIVRKLVTEFLEAFYL